MRSKGFFGNTHNTHWVTRRKMKFSSIVGQSHIKDHLRIAITSGRISQAYLITGERMQGKEFIARIFANALVCEDPAEGFDPCGKCKPCIQAATHNHPDIITVTHDKPNTERNSKAS